MINIGCYQLWSGHCLKNPQPASEKCNYWEELRCKEDLLKEDQFCFNQNQDINKTRTSDEMSGLKLRRCLTRSLALFESLNQPEHLCEERAGDLCWDHWVGREQPQQLPSEEGAHCWHGEDSRGCGCAFWAEKQHSSSQVPGLWLLARSGSFQSHTPQEQCLVTRAGTDSCRQRRLSRMAALQIPSNLQSNNDPLAHSALTLFLIFFCKWESEPGLSQQQESFSGVKSITEQAALQSSSCRVSPRPPTPTPKRSPWSSSQAVALSRDGTGGGGRCRDVVEPRQGLSFPEHPEHTAASSPGDGSCLLPAPPSERALGSELRAKPVPASPARLFLTRLGFFQLDIVVSLESTGRLQNVLSSSGFFN